MNLIKFKRRLAQIAKWPATVKRQIHLAALLSEGLRSIGQEPILVGGAAVAFYTQGAYITTDLDFVLPTTDALKNFMQGLGFQKLGKDFYHPQWKLYVEFPGNTLSAEERYQEIVIGDIPLKIVSLEDIIVDRLASFKFWKSEVDGVNALMLLEQTGVSPDRLRKRAADQEVDDTLKALLKLKEQAIRQQWSKTKTNQALRRLLR